MKRITISVINDLATDQRVHRMAGTLLKEGYALKLIGRQLKSSLAMSDCDYSIRRFRMLFKKGPLFYMFFNVRLFFSILFSPKPDLLIAIDLDTLLPNFLIGKLRNIPLVYDSHEYFTEVPELIHRPGVKGIWERLERLILPKLKYAISVSESISNIYQEKYGTEFRTIRNVPLSRKLEIDTNFHKKYPSKYMIIYQGALNVGRGLELMIDAMQSLDDVLFLIAGEGDIQGELKDRVDELKLNDRILFLGRVTPIELHKLTSQCNLGISLEEDMGLSYRYSLPNKLFDYIQGRIPVLCSNLPEMAGIIKKYRIGELVKTRDPNALSDQIKAIFSNESLNIELKENLEKAALELCWENEELKLMNILGTLFVSLEHK